MSLDYERLLYLSQKVKNRTATNLERDEYMYLLFENNNITQQQYNDYKAGRNVDDIVSVALTIGAIVLLGYLLRKLIE